MTLTVWFLIKMEKQDKLFGMLLIKVLKKKIKIVIGKCEL